MEWARFSVAVAIVLLMSTGCRTGGMSTGERKTHRSGGLVMVYGAGVSLREESKNTQGWMTVSAAHEDSIWEFGHIRESGAFAVLVTGPTGTFRARGGDEFQFALRSLVDTARVVELREYAFDGPPMPAQKAIAPVMQDSYYSIALLTFRPTRSDTVTVELLTSSPNGFSPAR